MGDLMVVYCPACDKPYQNMEELRAHLRKASGEADEIHIDVIELEGWDETYAGEVVKSASDLDPT